MTTTTGPCEPTQDDDIPCDQCPNRLDTLNCEGYGVAERAKYLADPQVGPVLAKARTDYQTARATYTKARDDAWQAVKDARHKLKIIDDQISCLVGNTETMECLKRAYDWVAQRLESCPGGGSGGCCTDVLDCTFDTGCEKEESALAGTIALYTQTTNAAQACFDKLIKEPTELKTRVSTLTTAVDALAKTLAGDTAKLDGRALWAKARVARRELDDVWLGFVDVNAYVRCLCTALTCMSAGHAAIAELTGRLATLHCEETAKQDCCTALRTKIEEAIVARYLKECPPDKPSGQYATAE